MLVKEINEAVTTEIEEVQKIVKKYFPRLWPAVDIGLATCATLLLQDNSNPVAVIYVGPPSTGKTTVANMFDGATVNGELLTYRSDKFTPASFVSHSANATKDQLLNEINLLPKIQHKVFITPELAPIFTGKQDDLTNRFSIITRVMDGQGLSTDSGTHGQIDCSGDYVFAWIGCTTPFSASVWKVMGNLGSRLFFLLMDAAAEPTIEEMVQEMKQKNFYGEGLSMCRDQIHKFLEILFMTHGGIRKVQWEADKESESNLGGIVRCAQLLALMRTPNCQEEEAAPQPESPQRANAILYSLARGRALAYGRTVLLPEDLPMIGAITLSSMPHRRRNALLALVESSGNKISVEEVESVTGVSRHTAEEIMEDMSWLGIAKFEKPGTGKASYLSICPEWKWVTSGEFKELLLQGLSWQKTGCVSI